MKSRFNKLLAGLSIALVLNLAACDIVASADEPVAHPDSSTAKPGKVEIPSPSASAKGTPIIQSEDGLDGPDGPPAKQPGEPGSVSENPKGTTPFYKNKWLWAIGTTVLAGTAAAIIVGRAEKTGKDLPGFPEPPTR
jgi:hypothetical protein